MKKKTKAERRRKRHQRRVNARTIKAASPIVNNDVALTGSIVFADGEDIEGAEGKKKPSTFTIEAYSGGLLALGTHRFPVVVDLSAMKARRESIPILKDHDPTQIVGHSTSIVNDGQSLTMTGVVSAQNATAAEVVGLAANGFPWEASIGATGRMTHVPKGKNAYVNGRQFEGPIYVAKDAVLRETSVVPMGADVDGATFNLTASAVPIRGDSMFDLWLQAQGQAKGFDPNDITAEERAEYRRQFDAELQAEFGKDDSDDDGDDKKKKKDDVNASANVDTIDLGAQLRQDAAAEATRVHAIRSIVAREGVTEFVPTGQTQPVSFEAHAISAGWDEATTAREAELHRLRASAPAIHTRQRPNGLEHGRDTIVAALLRQQSGFGEDQLRQAGFNDQTLEAADTVGTMGLHRLMHQTIHAAGGHYDAGQYDNGFCQEFERCNALIEASSGTAGFSLTSLGGILSAWAHKRMLAAFQMITSVVPIIAATQNVTNFKEHRSYRMNVSGDFLEVGPGGEIKHGALKESDFANRVQTYGQIITLTRQMMINDDLSALNGLSEGMGRKAAITREKQVLQLLLNGESAGGPFFSAENGNLLTSTALDIAGLTAARKAYAEQKDAVGDFIMLDPNRVLVPPALTTTADNLYQETTIVMETHATGSAKARPRRNEHAGNYVPSESPYLGAASSLANAADDAWYMFTDPADAAGLEVAYLNGNANPVIEQERTRADILGLMFRGYYDFGVAFRDHQAILKAKASA